MDRWPILRADAGGALLSAAARGAGCGADCVAAWLRLPGVSGRPAIGTTPPPPVQLDGAGGWSGRWPVMAAGASVVDDGEGVSAGVGGTNELELLELLLGRWRWRHAGTGGGVNSECTADARLLVTTY
jgi:hypothetical protein